MNAISPTSASPGTFVTVNGTGLLDAARFQSSSRESALFILGDGTEVPAPILGMTGNSAEILVPAAPIDTHNHYYHGPAQICLWSIRSGRASPLSSQSAHLLVNSRIC
jgi:hypothetical protein